MQTQGQLYTDSNYIHAAQKMQYLLLHQQMIQLLCAVVGCLLKRPSVEAAISAHYNRQCYQLRFLYKCSAGGKLPKAA